MVGDCARGRLPSCPEGRPNRGAKRRYQSVWSVLIARIVDERGHDLDSPSMLRPAEVTDSFPPHELAGGSLGSARLRAAAGSARC